jgi:hypothetical protein
MSMDAYRWALTWTGLTSPEKFVLVMIADHFNPDVLRAWPSRKTLAVETALSVSTISRSIAALEKEGLVEVEPWVNASTGSQMSNRYCLPLFNEKSTRALQLPVKVYGGFGPGGKWEYESAA